MTDRATLLALAERCEQAAGPNNGLDAEIALAIGYTHERRGTERACWWRTPAGQQLAYVGYKNHPPFFTGSLDAAVTLVPEGWAVELVQALSGSPWHATLRGGSALVPIIGATASKPALALCAAALRARAAAHD
jgi:hypothetical protein